MAQRLDGLLKFRQAKQSPLAWSIDKLDAALMKIKAVDRLTSTELLVFHQGIQQQQHWATLSNVNSWSH